MLVCGVDEVGRGPLVGDVVAAAVILDPNHPIEGLRDSKKLSEKKRENLAVIIKEKAKGWAIQSATAKEIDVINILQASLLAMKRAVLALKQHLDLVYVDGNKCPDLPYKMEAIVKGDSLIDEIKAASIIAKVERDKQMIELDKQHPEYGFKGHKGYPTKVHMEALAMHGPLDCHRRSYRPVQNALAALEEKCL